MLYLSKIGVKMKIVLLLVLSISILYSEGSLRYYKAFVSEKDNSIRVILDGSTHPGGFSKPNNPTQEFESLFMAKKYSSSQNYQLSEGTFKNEYELNGNTAKLASEAAQIPQSGSFLICSATKSGNGIQEIIPISGFVYHAYESIYGAKADLIAKLGPIVNIEKYSKQDGGLIAVYFYDLNILKNELGMIDTIIPESVQKKYEASASLMTPYWLEQKQIEYSLATQLSSPHSVVDAYSSIQPILIQSGRKTVGMKYLSISSLSSKNCDSEVVFMDPSGATLVSPVPLSGGKISRCSGIIRLNHKSGPGDLLLCYINLGGYEGGIALFQSGSNGLLQEIFFKQTSFD